jgi:hypothetical protein
MPIDYNASEPRPDDSLRYGARHASTAALCRGNIRKSLRGLKEASLGDISDDVLRYCMQQAYAGHATPPVPANESDVFVLAMAPLLMGTGPAIRADAEHAELFASMVENVMNEVFAEEFPATDGPIPGP